MAEPSPILFEVEGDVDGEVLSGGEFIGGFFTPSFELSGDNLPRDYQTGTKLRKTVTRYAGTYTSVQVHGEELKPIPFEGVFDDTWTGEPGGALFLKQTIEAIVLLGQIVRMEYEGDQLWGILEAEFKEKRRDRIEYTITFEPYWRNDPRFELYVAFAEPPNDLGENLDSVVNAFADHLGAAPTGVDLSFVGSVLTDVLHAQNQVGNVLGYVSDVGDYADLTAEVVGIVTRSLFSAARSLDSAASKMFAAGDSILANTATAKIAGSRWIYEGSRQSRRSLQDLIAMLRRFLEVRRPRRVRLHTVREGDTLQRLAEDFLGDFTRWTEIADANDLFNAELVVGSVLRIPPR